jgi:hypothetical protein
MALADEMREIAYKASIKNKKDAADADAEKLRLSAIKHQQDTEKAIKSAEDAVPHFVGTEIDGQAMGKLLLIHTITT